MPTIIEKHIIGFCGFTQKPQEEIAKQSGIFDIFDRLWAAKLSGVMIHTPYLWDHDIQHLASFIRGRGAKQVLLYGYSWGGCTAFNFCEEIAEMRVPAFYVSDPVRRPFAIAGRIPLVRKYFPFPIPRNVQHTELFRQEGTWPTGYGAKVHSTLNQSYRETVVKDTKHTEMDNCKEFHEAIISAAKLF